jgi:hypothetical protein
LLIGRVACTENRRFFSSNRWQRLMNLGAPPRRLLFASTATKDPLPPDDLYVAGLAVPHTVNMMPAETLRAQVPGHPPIDIDPCRLRPKETT